MPVVTTYRLVVVVGRVGAGALRASVRCIINVCSPLFLATVIAVRLPGNRNQGVAIAGNCWQLPTNRHWQIANGNCQHSHRPNQTETGGGNCQHSRSYSTIHTEWPVPTTVQYIRMYNTYRMACADYSPIHTEWPVPTTVQYIPNVQYITNGLCRLQSNTYRMYNT